MNYRFLVSIRARAIALDGTAIVSAASRPKAEAKLRATLADPDGRHMPLHIESHPEDIPEPEP